MGENFHSVKLDGNSPGKHFQDQGPSDIHNPFAFGFGELDPGIYEGADHFGKREERLSFGSTIPSFFNNPQVEEPPAQSDISKPNQKTEKKADQQPLTLQKEEGPISLNFKKSSHPCTCIFLFIFKAAAISLYVVFSWILDKYIAAFISVSVLLSIDFWFTKNIAGRRLVGLRWGIKIGDDGTEKWIFESRDVETSVSKVDYSVFWYFQVLLVLFWIVILVLNIIELHFLWFCLDLFCTILTGTNLVNFFRCSRAHQAKLKSLVKDTAQKAAEEAIKNAAVQQAAQDAVKTKLIQAVRL